jgi:hypothetical protein
MPATIRITRASYLGNGQPGRRQAVPRWLSGTPPVIAGGLRES